MGVDPQLGGARLMERPRFTIQKTNRPQRRSGSQPYENRREPQTGSCRQGEADIPQPQSFHVGMEPPPPQREQQELPSSSLAPGPSDTLGKQGTGQMPPGSQSNSSHEMDGIEKTCRHQGAFPRFKHGLESIFGEVTDSGNEQTARPCRHDQRIGNFEMLPIDQGNGHGKESEDPPPQRLGGIGPVSGHPTPCPSGGQSRAERLDHHVEDGDSRRAPGAFSALEHPSDDGKIAIEGNRTSALRTTGAWLDHGLASRKPPDDHIEKRPKTPADREGQ